MKFSLALSAAALLAAGAANAAALTDAPAGNYTSLGKITASTCGALSPTLAVGFASNSEIVYSPYVPAKAAVTKVVGGKTVIVTPAVPAVNGAFTSISGGAPTDIVSFATTSALTKISTTQSQVYAVTTPVGGAPTSAPLAKANISFSSIAAGAANAAYKNSNNATGATYTVTEVVGLPAYASFGCTSYTVTATWFAH